MLSFQLNDAPIFHDNNPYAEPLFVDKWGRVLRFALKPGQSVREHTAPHSPVYVMVLQGTGQFSGGDNLEHTHGPGSLLIFEPGEVHAIRAGDEDLVFVALLHGAPAAQ
jgi:quercetin dioxygenase-like cupin family protein